MDNMVNNMPQNDKTADATCVFRVPSSDVTVPDLMANVRITAPFCPSSRVRRLVPPLSSRTT